MNKTQEVKDIIDNLHGKFFSVKFIKKTGEEREMTCRTGVKKYVKGTAKKLSDEVIRVWEVDLSDPEKIDEKAYRSFRPETVVEIKAGGKVYNFEGVIK